MRPLYFMARFKKISTGEEIWQTAALSRGSICDPIRQLPGGYIQSSDWFQQLGIRDKFGIEIFEGSIVSGLASPQDNAESIAFIGVVKWDHEDTGFYYESDVWSWPCIKPWFASDIEVIGNSVENPEMVPE